MSACTIHANQAWEEIGTYASGTPSCTTKTGSRETYVKELQAQIQVKQMIMGHPSRPAPDLTWHRVEDVVRMPGPRVLVHEAQSKSHHEAGRPCTHQVNARVSGHCAVKAKLNYTEANTCLSIPRIFQ